MDFCGIRVLVLDGAGKQTHAMIRGLKDIGCHVTVLCSSKNNTCYVSNLPDEKILECRMDLSERMIKVAPAPHSSLGGIVIDSKCRVLDRDGVPVPGVFACGEVTAGVHGLNRLGGNGGTAAMVFGTIAGREVALEVKR